jgi:hypothetical protein
MPCPTITCSNYSARAQSAEPASVERRAGRGLPDLPVVEIPHPMHIATADQVAERAANAVKALEKALTETIVPSDQSNSPAILARSPAAT